MTTPRTRLQPVYLTATERDLVRQTIDVMTDNLSPELERGHVTTRTTTFARSFTRRRLVDLRALFEDKPDTTPSSS